MHVRMFVVQALACNSQRRFERGSLKAVLQTQCMFVVQALACPKVGFAHSQFCESPMVNYRPENRARENRTHGSEKGGPGNRLSLPPISRSGFQPLSHSSVATQNAAGCRVYSRRGFQPLSLLTAVAVRRVMVFVTKPQSVFCTTATEKCGGPVNISYQGDIAR